MCVRLGDKGELAACFNPDTLTLRGRLAGRLRQVLRRAATASCDGLHPGRHAAAAARRHRSPSEPFVYHGFYRHGKRVVFAYRIGDVEMLDAPWVEDGKFARDRRAGRRASARRT